MSATQESQVVRLHREGLERLRGPPLPPPDVPEIDLLDPADRLPEHARVIIVLAEPA